MEIFVAMPSLFAKLKKEGKFFFWNLGGSRRKTVQWKIRNVIFIPFLERHILHVYYMITLGDLQKSQLDMFNNAEN